MSGGGDVEEVKNRLDIVEVVGDYLQLKRAGTSHKACCPFHQEKTPSFNVNRERQIYHCFGCGEGGDVISFVQKMEGLEFIDALKLLARKAGVTLELRAGSGEKASERRKLLEINNLAAKMYRKLLLESPKAEAARAYVERRALANDTADEFGIGFAPDSWDATLKFLTGRGHTEEEVFKSGLAIRSERGTGLYDRFRGRLMFAIRDVHGETVGFTARLLPGADGKDPDGPKYVNTPQTLAYNKSRVLYGLNLAKQAIRQEGLAVVVEGNMDVVSSHQAGVRNVVASSGTALTREQLDLLKRFTDRLTLSFDMDSAGESAARRGIDDAVAAGFSVRVLRLPAGAGKDPDDCIREDVEIWKKAIADAVPYMQWYLELAGERTDFADAESKRRSAGELLAEIAKIPDAVEQAHWIAEVARLFSTPESLLFEQVRRIAGGIKARRTGEGETEKPKAQLKKGREELVTEHVLALALRWPDFGQVVIAAVEPENVCAELFELYKIWLRYYTSERNDGDTAGSFRKALESRGSHEHARRVAVLELLAEDQFGELQAEERTLELGKLIGGLKELQNSRRKQELARAMAAAEQAGDMEKIRAIEDRLKSLTGQPDRSG
ncbi:DNA primase [Patescibacteria group bacterium]